MIFLRLIVFGLGTIIVASTVTAAIKTFILPRGVQVQLTRVIFQSMGWLFSLRVRGKDYAERDHIMAFYAPLTLF